jgi:GNAT superfamily N-acetyltransferase
LGVVDGGAARPTDSVTSVTDPPVGLLDSRGPTLSHVELVVRVAELAEVRPLQLAVLRPHGPLPGDQPPPADALHVAALRDGVVIGAATVLPERWPGPGAMAEPVWRLRAVVVAEGVRGTGVGRSVVLRASELATSQGASSLWAEARSSALGFYERTGWTVIGDEWMKAGIGPHRYIRLDLRESAPRS